MKHFKHTLKPVSVGVFLSLYCAVPVLAEDIEIYTSLGNGTVTVKPNVLFILDNSGSMGSTVPGLRERFDVSDSYESGAQAATGCSYDEGAVYYSTDGNQPACGSDNYFELNKLQCDHANDEYNASGVQVSTNGPLEVWGTYADQLSQHSASNVWGKITKVDKDVECAQDQGVHGSNSSPTPNRYITNTSTGWQSTATSPPVWSGGKNNYTLYHGRYLNYLIDTSVSGIGTAPTRFAEVTRAITALIDTNTSINVGLMAFDEYNGAGFPLTGADRIDGGEVVYPMEDINTGRTNFKTAMAGIVANTGTPLSETYYEALRYYGGMPVEYGLISTPPSVAASQSGGNYISPITNECQRNSIIVLTDGEAWRDSLTVDQLEDLTDFTDTACGVSTADQPPPDACMNELAAWAKNKDVLQGTGPAELGEQTITTHTVGFANAGLGTPGSLIVTTAAEGGGTFVEAKDADTLRNEISRLFAEILEVDTSFSSPAVSVNAFNRSTHLEDLYFTLFSPAGTPHWAGNLKKYKLGFFVDSSDTDLDGDFTERLPFIEDQNGNNAVNSSTGFFDAGAQSFWSDSADGKNVEEGGAAAELENLSGSRKVYTYTGAYTNNNGVFVPDVSSSDLTDSDNEVDKSNSTITDVMLDIVATSPAVGSTPRIETLLDWASGLDAVDSDNDGDTSEVRTDMGDPLHSQPALVQYGGTAAVPDLVAYVATNDGYLHAIDADDGKEIFSFIPQELLPNLNVLMDNSTSSKTYGLDGDVVAWIDDADKNGKIEGTEHVYLYITMRRGGNNIYSIDVTDRDNPVLRWVIKGGTGDYAELGQTWSTVNVEKVKNGSSEKVVLIFGGGYDENQDNTTVRTADGVGRAIFIADAETGARLWSAGVGGDLAVTDMDYSIPARVKPLDLSGDGFIDRLYVADVGGQIFRFDIDNANNALLTSSVTGGRIADLADTGISNARRFYYPPDVALIAEDGKTPYLGVAITSGFRAHPNLIDVHDRIYLLKDKDIYNTPTTYVTLTEADLYDATLNLVATGEGTQAQNDAAQTALNANDGWYISLDDGTNSNTWEGEKGLSEVLILDGAVIATTFIPDNSSGVTNSCTPRTGAGRTFFVDLLDGSAAYPANTDTRTNRVTTLSKEGIPPSPNVIITKGGEPTLCIGTECSAANITSGVRKTYWYEVEQ